MVHIVFLRPLLDQRLTLLVAQAFISLLQAANEAVLQDTALHTPEEESTRVLPADALFDHTLGLHAPSTIVQVGEGGGHGGVQRQQLLLPGLDLFLNGLLLFTTGRLKVSIQLLELLIHTVHRLHLLMSSILHFHNARRFQDSTAGIHVGIHLHLVRVDGRINHHPGATSQLTMLGDVDEDGMLVLHQGIHDHGTELQDLVVHVPGATRKATPIGKDHHWKVLTTVEILQSLRSFEGAVREPHLSTHGFLHFTALRV
mmetsp:Transcript_106782/g.130225  ORF Transcript_106782/g.130225 Transcript_106782/m.130225 type:complete len:257 (-) Transcript_106782:583-1353(-)